MASSTLAIILAGGSEGDFGLLTVGKRGKAALPFAGMFRIVDFALTSVSQASIDKVGVIIQYLPGALIEHIEVGSSWELNRHERMVKLMPPFVGIDETAWYKGTGDAIYQNSRFIKRFAPDNVVVCYGEHVYNIDFDNVVAFHQEHDADVTVVSKELSSGVTSRRLCRLIPHDDNPLQVQACVRNSSKYERHPVATGIYVFKTDVLLKLLDDMIANRSGYSLSTNVIAVAPDEYRVFNYAYSGYWNELNSVDEYFIANMSLLEQESPIDLQKWQVVTNPYDRQQGFRPPAFVHQNAYTANSLISPGCEIYGKVERSILSPGVIVEEGAHVTDSILMHDAVIEKNARLRYVVCDKDTRFVGETVYGIEHNPIAQELPQLSLFDKKDNYQLA